MLKRLVVLVVLALFALGSLSGYLIFNRFIIQGSLKIAAGQVQIVQGEHKLAKGKARLASGERELANGKKTYGEMGRPTLLAAASIIPITLPFAVLANNDASHKLAEGGKQVTEGR